MVCIVRASDLSRDNRFFLFSETPIPALGPTHPIQCITGVKWPGREADNFHLMSRLRRSGAVLLFAMCLHSMRRENFKSSVCISCYLPFIPVFDLNILTLQCKESKAG
jgi:hypothetical protein